MLAASYAGCLLTCPADYDPARITPEDAAEDDAIRIRHDLSPPGATMNKRAAYDRDHAPPRVDGRSVVVRHGDGQTHYTITCHTIHRTPTRIVAEIAIRVGGHYYPGEVALNYDGELLSFDVNGFRRVAEAEAYAASAGADSDDPYYRDDVISDVVGAIRARLYQIPEQGDGRYGAGRYGAGA